MTSLQVALGIAFGLAVIGGVILFFLNRALDKEVREMTERFERTGKL